MAPVEICLVRRIVHQRNGQISFRIHQSHKLVEIENIPHDPVQGHCLVFLFIDGNVRKEGQSQMGVSLLRQMTHFQFHILPVFRVGHGSASG